MEPFSFDYYILAVCERLSGVAGYCVKPFSFDYYMLVTVSAVGALQLAAMRGGLRGLLFFQSPRATALLGFALPVAAALWFFITKDRKLSDHMGGLSSNEIAFAFFAGVVTAWVVTMALSSVLNHNARREHVETGAGLKSLAATTYLRALVHNVRYWWRECRRQIGPYFSG